MRFRTEFGVLAILAFALAAPLAVADESDLAGRVASWQDAFNAGDDAALAAYYTEDCIRMPYQAEAVNGREALLASIATTRAMGIAKIELAATEGESHGNTAWGSGTYALMDADGNVLQAGKWLNVSVKVGDAWLIHRDIWNTDTAE